MSATDTPRTDEAAVGLARLLIDRETSEIVELVRADFARQLERELAQAKTTMVAAAEEIAEHWDAHCDEEGYGPANLMRRLEEGIPSQYGYTAGAFAKLTAELAEAYERAAQVCDDKAAAMARKAEDPEYADDEYAIHLKSTAWTLTVCAAAIRALIPK